MEDTVSPPRPRNIILELRRAKGLMQDPARDQGIPRDPHRTMSLQRDLLRTESLSHDSKKRPKTPQRQDSYKDQNVAQDTEGIGSPSRDSSKTQPKTPEPEQIQPEGEYLENAKAFSQVQRQDSHQDQNVAQDTQGTESPSKDSSKKHLKTQHTQDSPHRTGNSSQESKDAVPVLQRSRSVSPDQTAPQQTPTDNSSNAEFQVEITQDDSVDTSDLNKLTDLSDSPNNTVPISQYAGQVNWVVLETQPTQDGPYNIFLNDPYHCPISAVVPFFNEEPEEIYKTLHDMHLGQKAVKKNLKGDIDIPYIFHPIIIMDGYTKSSQRTIDWCQSMFPSEPWEIFTHLTPDKKESAQTISWFKQNALRCVRSPSKQKLIITDDKSYNDKITDPLKEYAVVFQIRDPVRKGNLYPCTIRPPKPPYQKITDFSELFAPSNCYCNPCDVESVEEFESFEMILTLIVKTRNRQKHDSHWFSICPNGFIESYPSARYVFFTDCGTLYDEECFYYMLREFDNNKDVGAVTGRQRVMNAKQQDGAGEGLVSEFLRHVQRSDFELSFACSVGAFALAGCLPVLPGPFGLYKREIILTGAAEFYHSFLSMDSLNIGVIEANIQIAEDRVLSISPFFSQKWKSDDKQELINYPNMQTTVAPEATFYYESESNLMSLVKQRRRWINGTIATYLWLLIKKPGLIWSFNISIWRRLLIYFLVFTQAYQFLFVFLSPSIFIMLFRTALHYSNWRTGLASDYWWYIIVGLYVVFSFACSYGYATDWQFYVGFMVGAAIEIISIAGISRSIVTQVLLNQTEFYKQIGHIDNGIPPANYIGHFYWTDFIPFGLLFLSCAVPLIAALVASPRSFVYIVRSGLMFVLFLPTLVAIFGIYSICNFSDFSWGNRDSEGANQKIGSRLSMLQARGKFYGFFFLGVNIMIILLAIDLLDFWFWRMATSIAIFGLPLCCMLLSFLYWVGWRLSQVVRCCLGIFIDNKIDLSPPIRKDNTMDDVSIVIK